MTKQDLRDIFAKAAELADTVPERYRDRAFELAVKHSLGEVQLAQGIAVHPVGDASQPQPNATPSAIEPWLARVLDGAPEAAVVAESGTRNHQATYAVIQLTKVQQKADVEAVRKYLRDKLGVTPQSSSHTSDTLKGLLPRYLSRDSAREGRGFEYAPTSKSLEVFSDLSRD